MTASYSYSAHLTYEQRNQCEETSKDGAAYGIENCSEKENEGMDISPEQREVP